MFFIIDRTSDYGFRKSDPPCKNAVVKTKTSKACLSIPFEKREMETVEKIEEVPYWAVEINTLEDLMALRKEVDAALIIFDDSIEIYDDYRE